MSKGALLIGIVVGVILLGVVMSVVTGTNTAAEVACNSQLDGEGWGAQNVSNSDDYERINVTCVKDNRSENISFSPSEYGVVA